jgi:hypothetical protein
MIGVTLRNQCALDRARRIDPRIRCRNVDAVRMWFDPMA